MNVVLSSASGVETVEHEGLVYYEAELWQGREVRFKIRCQCGGETEILTVPCRGVSDILRIPLSVTACGQCGGELYAGIYFYAYEEVEHGKVRCYDYHWWRWKLFPLRIKCPCGSKSYPVFVRCLGPRIYDAIGRCQGCQAVLRAELEFYHI